MSNDYEEGLESRRQVLGDEWVDRSLANLNDFNSEFQNFITRYVWKEIWTRPGIDQKTRRYMVLSTMMALGRWEEFRLHIGAAVRAGYQSAPYQVIRTDGKFELRDYPELVLVETRSQGADNSFMRLFHYIGGQNAASQKISMTTPVFMTGSTMAFVMPAGLKAVPVPTVGSVTVKEIPAGRFAVFQYSGERSRSQEKRTLAELKAWMEAKGLPILSQPLYGYFDPPWTPTFLRRNEVMLRTETRPSIK